jgi:hypothetical protein
MTHRPLPDDIEAHSPFGAARVDISVLGSDALESGTDAALLRDTCALVTRRVDAPRESVESRLRELPQVALFRERGGALVGVAGVDIQRVTFENQARIVIFTTNVAFDDRYRTSDLLVRLGLRLFLAERRRHPLHPIDWLLATFDRHCYALLPRNFFRFWPQRGVATCDWARAYIDFLMRERYGSRWRPRQGIIAAGDGDWRPRDSAEVEPCIDLDARHFDMLNATSTAGDLLVCLCPLSIDNWVHALARAVRRRRAAAPANDVIRSSALHPGQ